METQPGRILVIDDGRMARMLLARQLSGEGHEVVEAECGEDGLALLKEGTFDLVILDVLMPGLGGIETLEKIRESHTADELPVIMATAQDQLDTMVEAFEKGANDYVTKPVMFPILRARLNTHLRLLQALRKLSRAAIDGAGGGDA